MLADVARILSLTPEQRLLETPAASLRDIARSKQAAGTRPRKG
ncbi:MAG: hypothetical protein ACT4P3_20260 [Betaproteobacteria bacterium]